MNKQYNLDDAIRKVPDFPKPGILFYDITGILMNPEAFSYTIDRMFELYGNRNLQAVAAVEARGFLFAAPLAQRMGLPIILVRKKGKLPGKTLEKKFTLEYGEDILQVQVSDVPENGNVLLIDDLVATGGTLKAALDLLEEGGAVVRDIFCIIGLPFLEYHKTFQGYRVTTLIDYHGE